MRISDWSSDVCSSDLPRQRRVAPERDQREHQRRRGRELDDARYRLAVAATAEHVAEEFRRLDRTLGVGDLPDRAAQLVGGGTADVDRCQRSEEHTSELQSLMRISYAVFCLKKKKKIQAKKANCS